MLKGQERTAYQADQCIRCRNCPAYRRRGYWKELLEATCPFWDVGAPVIRETLTDYTNRCKPITFNHQGLRLTRSFAATEKVDEVLRKRHAEYAPRYLIGCFNRAGVIEDFEEWCERFRSSRAELPRRAESRRRIFAIDQLTDGLIAQLL